VLDLPGKSTFAKRFLKANPDFERVNQDELKTRKRCEAVAEAHLKEGKSVIVDRCNFDYQQRLTWIKLGDLSSSCLSPLALFLVPNVL